MLVCQPVRQVPVAADQLGKPLIPLAKVLQEPQSRDVIFRLQPRSGLVGVPDVRVTEKLVTEPGNAARSAKIPRRKERLELVEPKMVLGTGHNEQGERLFGQELVSDAAAIQNIIDTNIANVIICSNVPDKVIKDDHIAWMINANPGVLNRG